MTFMKRFSQWVGSNLHRAGVKPRRAGRNPHRARELRRRLAIDPLERRTLLDASLTLNVGATNLAAGIASGPVPIMNAEVTVSCKVPNFNGTGTTFTEVYNKNLS